MCRLGSPCGKRVLHHAARRLQQDRECRGYVSSVDYFDLDLIVLASEIADKVTGVERVALFGSRKYPGKVRSDVDLLVSGPASGDLLSNFVSLTATTDRSTCGSSRVDLRTASSTRACCSRQTSRSWSCFQSQM